MKWLTGSRLTTRCLQTSSICSSSAAGQHFCRRWRHPSSSSAPGLSQSLLRLSSVSAAVAIETVVHPARPSSRTPSAVVAVDLLASSGRRTSSSSSSSSSSMSERRHPVARRPWRPDTLRHRPLHRSFVVTCVYTHSTRCMRTLVVSGRSCVSCEF